MTHITVERGARRSGEEPGSLRQRSRVCLGDSPIYDQEIAIGPQADGWAGPAVTGGNRAVGSVLVLDPAWEEHRPPMPTRQPVDAVLLPLTGPAVLLTALAQDALALRRSLESGAAVLRGVADLAGAAAGDADRGP